MGIRCAEMTEQDRKELMERCIHERPLYSVYELSRALYALGHDVPVNDLYLALKATGWVKLRLIRDRLVLAKRKIPKAEPFGAIRQIIKWPLLVKRNEDLPEWRDR